MEDDKLYLNKKPWITWTLQRDFSRIRPGLTECNVFIMTLAQKPRSELIKHDNIAFEVIVTVVKDGDAIKKELESLLLAR